MARPKKQWSDEQYRMFEGLCRIQCTIAEIENITDTDHKTIDRLCVERYGMGFSQSYKKYSDGGKMSLRRAQFRLAERNAAMAIWLGKQYLMQRDIPEDAVDTEDSVAYFSEAFPDA